MNPGRRAVASASPAARVSRPFMAVRLTGAVLAGSAVCLGIAALFFLSNRPMLLARTNSAADSAGLASPPEFHDLPSLSDDSALSMTCDGDRPFAVLRCHLTQVMVSRSPARPLSQSEAAQILSRPWVEARRQWDATCQEFASDPSADVQASDGGRGKTAAREQYAQILESICACRDNPCLLRALERMAELETQSCHVWTHSFDLSFRRVPGQRKWVSETVPAGRCSVATVTAIELASEDRNGVLWAYTQKRTVLNRSSGDCARLDAGAASVYTWRAANRSLLNCRFVSFGIP